jgi:hypothetical protein
MLTSKAKLSATAAALWMTVASFAGPAAAQSGYPISAARAAALQECSGLADEPGFAYAYRTCMAQHGQRE